MKCTIDGCEKEAGYTFVWPWGAPGACCQGHVVVVQQKARATRGRHGIVSFTNLDPDRPREITRDERVELHSARLVAEAEKGDAQKRAAQLFEVNTKLQQELSVTRARCAQFEAQTKELTLRVADALRERDLALVSADEARAEAERLGVNIRDRDTPTEGAHVVE